MNRIIATVALCTLLASVLSFAQTHFEVELQNLVSEQDDVSPAMDAYMTHAFDEKFGSFAWFMVGEHWAEGYAGITYSPQSWCQLGFGVGLEQADNPWRIGGSVWMGYERWSLLTLLEEGGGAFWYRVVANFRASNVFGIGVMSEEFVGMGPRLEVNIPKTPIQVWASLLREGKTTSGYVTLKLHF